MAPSQNKSTGLVGLGLVFIEAKQSFFCANCLGNRKIWNPSVESNFHLPYIEKVSFENDPTDVVRQVVEVNKPVMVDVSTETEETTDEAMERINEKHLIKLDKRKREIDQERLDLTEQTDELEKRDGWVKTRIKELELREAQIKILEDEIQVRRNTDEFKEREANIVILEESLKWKEQYLVEKENAIRKQKEAFQVMFSRQVQALTQKRDELERKELEFHTINQDFIKGMT